MKKIAGFLLILSLFSSLQAEVVKLKMKWDTKSCTGGCQFKLDQLLKKMKGADSVTTSSGESSIQWKTDVPFDLATMNYQIRANGVVIDSIDLTVKGTVVQTGNDLYLVSSGDNVRYLLLGPNQGGNPHQVYTVEKNVSRHPLSSDMRTSLLQSGNNKQIITIDGRLLNVLYNTHNLVVNSVTYPQPKQ